MSLFEFKKRERISHPQEFRRVMKSGRRVHSRNLLLFIQENTLGFHRLGIVVKKEVGPASYRNRIKRYVREFFRLHKHRIQGSLDLIVLTKKGCLLKRYQDAEDELIRTLVR